MLTYICSEQMYMVIPHRICNPLRNLRFACQIFPRRSYISVKGEYDDEHAI